MTWRVVRRHIYTGDAACGDVCFGDGGRVSCCLGDRVQNVCLSTDSSWGSFCGNGGAGQLLLAGFGRSLMPSNSFLIDVGLR